MADDKKVDPAKLGPSLEWLTKHSNKSKKQIIKLVSSGKKLDSTMRKLSKIRYEELIKETKELSKQLEELYRRQAQGEAGLEHQVSAMEKLRASNMEQAEAVGELSGSMGKLDLAAKAASAAILVLSAAVTGIKAAYDKWLEVKQEFQEVDGQLLRSSGATEQQMKRITDLAHKNAEQFSYLGKNVNGYADSAKFIEELAVATRNVNRATSDIEFGQAMLAISKTTGLATEGTVEFERALRAMGLAETTDQLLEQSQALKFFAEDIGTLPEAVFKDFVKSKDSIAKFGKEGVKVFKDVSRLANKFGMEADVIFKAMEKFDTFGAASDDVNQFNAILGTTISSYEMMMTTDPAQRMEMLRNAVKQAGLSWETMNYHQKKAYASGIGMSEEMAARTLEEGTSLEELRKIEKKASLEAQKNEERKLSAQENFTKALERSALAFETIAREAERTKIAAALSMDTAFTKTNQAGIKALKTLRKGIEREGDISKEHTENWIAGMEVILSTFTDFMNHVFSDPLAAVEQIGKGILKTVEQVGSGMMKIIDDFILTPITNAITRFISFVVESFVEIKNKVLNFFDPIITLISKIESLMSKMPQNIMTGFNEISSLENKTINVAKETIIKSELGSVASEIGNNVSQTANSLLGMLGLGDGASRSPVSAMTSSPAVAQSSAKTSSINNSPNSRITIVTSDIRMDGKKVGEAYVEAALGR